MLVSEEVLPPHVYNIARIVEYVNDILQFLIYHLVVKLREFVSNKPR